FALGLLALRYLEDTDMMRRAWFYKSLPGLARTDRLNCQFWLNNPNLFDRHAAWHIHISKCLRPLLRFGLLSSPEFNSMLCKSRNDNVANGRVTNFFDLVGRQ